VLREKADVKMLISPTDSLRFADQKLDPAKFFQIGTKSIHPFFLIYIYIYIYIYTFTFSSSFTLCVLLLYCPSRCCLLKESVYPWNTTHPGRLSDFDKRLGNYCGFVQRLQHEGATYAFRPMPSVGLIEASSVFFLKDALAAEKILFSEFIFTAQKSLYLC
jgi:hypothetical protein